MSRVFRLGLFIVAALLILGAGVFLIGSKQLRFRRTYQLKALFPNVGGLQEGAGVRVGGTHQGTVKRIDLPDRRDGQIVVVMNMEPRTQRHCEPGIGGFQSKPKACWATSMSRFLRREGRAGGERRRHD